VANSAKHAAIRHRLEEVGIIPSIHASSADEATFAARTVFLAGITVVEISMTVPDALAVIADFAQHAPGLIVGADSAWDLDSARQAVDAGAMFITSPGLDARSTLEFVIKEDVVVIPGALTPTEVSAAWQSGADFVKVFPCAAMGGPRYIRSLSAPLPSIPLIAAGGVNQVNAADYIAAGAVVLGIGTELIPKEALASRNASWITELARRFLDIVSQAKVLAGLPEPP
jgi:2-dehydro-3-deoxyphosphogluconate aldolase/(4S)-4-hydroxy-2-oxoglutarate aldolase